MDKGVVYVHGQGGSAEEAAHYRLLFADCEVIGLDYTSQYPWEAEEEFPRLLAPLLARFRSVSLIANSIGAYFAMCAFSGAQFEKAYFISPVVDMEKLICDMMGWAGVTEEELYKRGEIETSFGQTLSWRYLTYAREHPANWCAPTHILYAGKDSLTSHETVSGFARKAGATLTVMEDGEHWFHTEKQMQFLDRWITYL